MTYLGQYLYMVQRAMTRETGKAGNRIEPLAFLVEKLFAKKHVGKKTYFVVL